MPAVADSLEVAIPRKIWTRQEAHALVDLGFPNAEKLELIEGQLIDRMGKKHPHVLWQHLVYEWLRSVFGPEFVQRESPSGVSTADNIYNEPEPDLIVTARPIHDYVAAPLPSDLRLLVEISDSAVEFDSKVKGPLYARAEIAEYWIVNIRDKKLVVHHNPINGLYTSITTYDFQPIRNAFSSAQCSFLCGSARENVEIALSFLWRRHSCLPRRHSCRRLLLPPSRSQKL